MKRIVPLLLALLLAVGCVSTAAPVVNAAASSTQAPASPSPEPAREEPRPEAYPLVTGPLAFFRFEDAPDPSAGPIFSFDLDRDGVAEDFSFVLRPDDEWATAIVRNGSTVVLEVGDEPVSAEVLDLDPESPFYNLLVTFDYGSDSYVTVELHPENGQLVQGRTVWGDYRVRDGVLWFDECAYLLGTIYGTRSYHGDELIPDSEWLDSLFLPTEEELETDLDDMIDIGFVVHAVQPVPCFIDGREDALPAETLLYVTRFMDADLDLAVEVRTLDGTVAQLWFYDDDEEPHDPGRIYTGDLDEYFDNLFFPD